MQSSRRRTLTVEHEVHERVRHNRLRHGGKLDLEAARGRRVRARSGVRDDAPQKRAGRLAAAESGACRSLHTRGSDKAVKH